MQNQPRKWWPAAIAVIVVAVLLFAGGYAAGLLHGQGNQPASSNNTPAVAASSTPSVASSDVPAVAATNEPGTSSMPAKPSQADIDENGTYTSKDEVALYLHRFGHLPSNYISKSKAKKAGWVASEGNLDDVCPGMSIGGSEFYNYEGQLPDAPGRTYTECDINYEGGYRGAERIVFSNDGLVFYTPDHYETFEQLY